MLAAIRNLWDGCVGRGSSVDIATCYGLEDAGFDIGYCSCQTAGSTMSVSEQDL